MKVARGTNHLEKQQMWVWYVVHYRNGQQVREQYSSERSALTRVVAIAGAYVWTPGEGMIDQGEALRRLRRLGPVQGTIIPLEAADTTDWNKAA